MVAGQIPADFIFLDVFMITYNLVFCLKALQRIVPGCVISWAYFLSKEVALKSAHCTEPGLAALSILP